MSLNKPNYNMLGKDLHDLIDSHTAQLAEKAQQSDLDTTNNEVALKADKTYVDSQISNIGNSSPKGAYATLSALQSAFPTGTTGIYVVTADGNWYYWNGSAWTVGGVYQSTGIPNGSIGYDQLSTDIVTVDESSNILNLADSSQFDISSDGIPTTISGQYGYKIPIINGKRYGLFRSPSSGTGMIAWTPRVSITDAAGNVLTSYIGTANDITINNASAAYMWLWNSGWGLSDYTTYNAMVIQDYMGTTPNSYIPYYKNYVLNAVPTKLSQLKNDMGFSVGDWVSKNESTYGDSITAINNGYGGQSMSSAYQSMWGAYVHTHLNMGSFYGRGIGSSTFCYNTQTWYANSDGSYNSRPGDGVTTSQPAGTTVHKGYFSSWDRIKTMYPDSIRNSIDLILVMGGTNDFIVNNPLGGNPIWSSSNTTDSDWVADTTYYNGGDFDITNFKGAIASTVMKLQTRCPNAVIVLMTQLSGEGSNTSKNPKINTLNLNPVDYANALKEAAQYMSIPCIDIFGTTEINNINGMNYLASDGIHPYTVAGNKAVARAVISGLKGIIPNIA